MPSPAIVVLTDFLAVSNRALAYAAALAVPLQAHLVLLHVRHDGLLAPDGYHHRPGERQARQALQQLAASQPVPAQVETSEEFLPEAVAEAVRHHHPLLLVLGRPGTASAPAEVVTSAALDLLRHAPYPLLIVPTVGWQCTLPQRLLLAVDGEPFALRSAPQLLPALQAQLPAELLVLHVTDQPDPGAATSHRVVQSVRRSGVATLPAHSQPHVVYHAHAAEGILEGAAETDADLVVLVARRHSLLGSLFHRSVTAQLISQSTLPLLLLPALD
ncbi:universal stress protein [Hymenobacter sp. 15J16-1T3B]|uniref:universal stress protein n=1 Tax=Hymenobacter sp. 15J16-1T3B TaxID=2886941 RepID=UPI001D12A0EB|nr:universal stress protein [Hymenobacter sp. 15J16-1T3B]MCC3156679.1 universal stress protein [Hymenobacter sp. 15J16-1T3B]